MSMVFVNHGQTDSATSTYRAAFSQLKIKKKNTFSLIECVWPVATPDDTCVYLPSRDPDKSQSTNQRNL